MIHVNLVVVGTPTMHAPIGRSAAQSRAALLRTRAVIAQATERISESREIIRRHGAAPPPLLGCEPLAPSDEERSAMLDRIEAMRQQRQIDSEVLTTARALQAWAEKS